MQHSVRTASTLRRSVNHCIAV